jgi:hypothetical protein
LVCYPQNATRVVFSGRLSRGLREVAFQNLRYSDIDPNFEECRCNAQLHWELLESSH